MQAQTSVPETPHPVVGVVVPLPDAAKGPTVEGLGAVVGGVGGLLLWDGIVLNRLSGGDARLEPCARSTAQIALKTNHRPTILPCDRHQADSTANGVEVLHEQCPP